KEAAEADALRKELGLDDKLRKAKGAERKRKRSKRSDDDDDDAGSDEGDADGIKALIRQRTNSRMSAIIANIEEKYVSKQNAGGKKSRKNGASAKQKKQKTSAVEEPSEEEFLALQAKLFAKK
ncbi:hypothetical protein H4S06_000149, partial [Coemansia sp. BCRC 34490]